MAKYKVLQQFEDIETGEVYEGGQEIEMTVRRAEEAAKNLKKWDGDFLERIDNKKEEDGDGEGEGKEKTETTKEENKQGDE